MGYIVIIHGRIIRVIVDGDPRCVRYADGVTHSQWVNRTLRSADRRSANGIRSLCDTRPVCPTVSGSAERCDPQTGGQPTGSAVCAIRERCDPQSVSLSRAAICSQVVSGRAMTIQPDSFNQTRSTGFVQPDSFNFNRTHSIGLIQPDSFNRTH